MKARISYTQNWAGEILKDTYYKEIDGEHIVEEVYSIKEALFSDPCVKSADVEVEIEKGKWSKY